MLSRNLKVIGAVIGVVILLQLFGRYSYTNYHRVALERIDRLTGGVCRLPCIPPTPMPPPTPFDASAAADEYKNESEQQDQDAILLAKAASTAAGMQSDDSKYAWSAKLASEEQVRQGGFIAWATTTPPPANSANFATRLVCYCDSKGSGWQWEVHIDTNAVYYINDNADLMKKYGLTPGK
jgi:hypothetical protein